MNRFIRLTTVDMDNAEHVDSMYQVSQLFGCIQAGDRTLINVAGDSIVVLETVEEIYAMVNGYNKREELN